MIREVLNFPDDLLTEHLRKLLKCRKELHSAMLKAQSTVFDWGEDIEEILLELRFRKMMREDRVI